MNITKESLDKVFSEMVLSVSGWRKIFAQFGNPEDFTPEISEEDKLICTACGETFVKELNLNKDSSVFIARDARPTGVEICRIIASVLVHYGVKVCYAGICSAPEAMAQSTYKPYSCFIYVSASHNPIGYNGIKVGKNGGVFNGQIAKPMIARLKNTIKDFEGLLGLYNTSKDIVITESTELKAECLENYADFVRKTTAPDNNFKNFADNVRKLGAGIVADLNGSARCMSIDKTFLASLGIKTCFINDTAGKVAHAIVPEGENLIDCRKLLEKMHKEDSSFVLGYVPDNDGDRGNLVFINKNGNAEILKAQEVFALCVYATLSYFSKLGKKNLAVAVNCSTSMRIDEIASEFNAKVFRAEVGEANVVSLAEHLREQGYCVPILGEGANGGNITHPAKVRDPMNTLMCMLRLLQSSSIAETLDKLPVYTTTDAFFADGVLKLNTTDFKTLKRIYEQNFPEEWNKMATVLSEYGIESYLEFQTEGIVERQEKGNGDKGGLKIVFYNRKKEALAFIWMRPSGTEPIFRVLTDVKGNNTKLHDILNNWQRTMILNAEKAIK